MTWFQILIYIYITFSLTDQQYFVHFTKKTQVTLPAFISRVNTWYATFYFYMSKMKAVSYTIPTFQSANVYKRTSNTYDSFSTALSHTTMAKSALRRLTVR